MAYGDSYGAVQSADLAEEQARRQSYQHGLANASRGFQDMRQANIDQLAVQRMADEDLRWKLQMNRQEKNDAALQADRERRLALDRDYLDVAKQQAAKGDVVDNRQALARAMEHAETGAFKDEKDVQDLFGVPAQFAKGIYARNLQARMGIEADREDAEHASTVLNTYQETQEKIADLEKKIDATKGNYKTLWKDQPGHEQAIYELNEQQKLLKRLQPEYQFLKETKPAILQYVIPREGGKYGVSGRLATPWRNKAAAAAAPAPTTPAAAAVPPPAGYPADFPQQVRALISGGMTKEQAVAAAKLKLGIQ